MQGSQNQGANYAQRRTIVDGQQRLTTFLLFMKVLCLKQNQMTSFDLQFRIMGKEIALRHGKNDIDAFETVVSAEQAKTVENPTGSRIIDAFNYFVQNLDASKLNIMTILMNAQFVKIDLNCDEDEQQIFDTINSLGVRLTTAELLKNYFYSRQDIEQYNKTWVEVFEKDLDTQAYWCQEFEMGRITRTLIDVFFDSYFQLFVQNSKYKVSAEDKIAYSRVEELSKSYQDFIRNYCGGNKQEIISPMAQYARKFREIFDPDCVNRQIPKMPGIERINVIIFGLKNTTLVPYILYLACCVDDIEEFNKMMGILESYIMRRIVIKATTKNYNNLFVSLILNEVNTAEALLTALKRAGDSTTYVPSDDELLDGFKNSKLTNLQAKGVIYFIESGIRSEKSSVALLGFKQYSLEHLMPKKWRNHWTACSSEELSRVRDQKLLTLGNFAIITQALNTSISDADWTTKKTGKKGKPGLNQCAAGLLTMESVLSDCNWSEDSIESRAIWLCEKSIQLWSDIAPAIGDGTGIYRGADQAANTIELRKRYWTYALPFIKKENLIRGTFLNSNPVGSNTLSGYVGVKGFRIDCIANYDGARIDFYLNNNDVNKNKEAFDYLYSHKTEIEKKIGVHLQWSRADGYVASWIVYPFNGVSLGNEQDWPEMAEFHAKWSNRIMEAMLSFIPGKSKENEKMLTVSYWCREWAHNREDICYNFLDCNRNYTRFTTRAMSDILPDLQNAPSDWNTDTHYFYEINVMSTGKVMMQMVVNSKNITDEFRTICDLIQKYYPFRPKIIDWSYRIPFKTKPIKGDNLDKDSLFSYLDRCLEEVRVFEFDLKQKLIAEPLFQLPGE